MYDILDSPVAKDVHQARKSTFEDAQNLALRLVSLVVAVAPTSPLK